MMNAVYETSVAPVMENIPFATAMHNSPVPPLRYRGDCIEALGQCIPKDQVGGDLMDLVADGLEVITYVADVSGHGLRAGILMGMIKTAKFDDRIRLLVRALRGMGRPPIRQFHLNDSACCEVLETTWNRMLAELAAGLADD